MSVSHPIQRKNFWSRLLHFLGIAPKRKDTTSHWAWESNPKFYDWLIEKPKLSK